MFKLLKLSQWLVTFSSFQKKYEMFIISPDFFSDQFFYSFLLFPCLDLCSDHFDLFLIIWLFFPHFVNSFLKYILTLIGLLPPDFLFRSDSTAHKQMSTWTYGGTEKYLVTYQLCKFSNFKRWDNYKRQWGKKSRKPHGLSFK